MENQTALPFHTNLCAGIPLHRRYAVVASQYFHLERLQSIVFVDNIENTA